MSDWITDRLPTEADSDRYGYVWVTDHYGRVGRMPWNGVTYVLPWMPITSPEPYVKARRYIPEYSESYKYVVNDTVEDTRVAIFIPTKTHADLIAKIYEGLFMSDKFDTEILKEVSP